MKSLPDFKRGDTFSLGCTYKLGGVPTSIAGKTIASQIRTADNALVQALAVAVGDQNLTPGSFTLSATAAQSAAWPVAGLRCDIQITDGANVISTETFLVPVLQDVTQ